MPLSDSPPMKKAEFPLTALTSVEKWELFSRGDRDDLERLALYGELSTFIDKNFLQIVSKAIADELDLPEKAGRRLVTFFLESSDLDYPEVCAIEIFRSIYFSARGVLKDWEFYYGKIQTECGRSEQAAFSRTFEYLRGVDTPTLFACVILPHRASQSTHWNSDKDYFIKFPVLGRKTAFAIMNTVAEGMQIKLPYRNTLFEVFESVYRSSGRSIAELTGTLRMILQSGLAGQPEKLMILTRRVSKSLSDNLVRAVMAGQYLHVYNAVEAITSKCSDTISAYQMLLEIISDAIADSASSGRNRSSLLADLNILKNALYGLSDVKFTGNRVADTKILAMSMV